MGELERWLEERTWIPYAGQSWTDKNCSAIEGSYDAMDVKHRGSISQVTTARSFLLELGRPLGFENSFVIIIIVMKNKEGMRLTIYRKRVRLKGRESLKVGERGHSRMDTAEASEVRYPARNKERCISLLN